VGRRWRSSRPLLARQRGASEEIPKLAPFLAEAGHSLYAPDAPGYGGSPALDPNGYRPSALAELAARLIDSLGIAPAVWIGSSWGASIGMHTAARFPTRIGAFALLDGGYMDAGDDPDYDPLLELDARTADLRARAERGESWDASPEVIALAMQAADQEPCSTLLPAVKSSDSSSARASHGTVRVRVDQGPAFERFRAALAGAELIALPGTGDHLLGEAAPEVERILLDWLRRRPARRECG
jgi:pimeloyl-ACP methyl ester carboxylesterase